MKKLFALILALLLLCSCGAREEAITEKPQSEPNVPESAEKMVIVNSAAYKGKNGKFGFHKGKNAVTEAVFEEILPVTEIKDDEVQAWGLKENGGFDIYAGIVTKGTRKAYNTDMEGVFFDEVQNSFYTLYDSEKGVIINEVPLQTVYFEEPHSWGNGLDSWKLAGTNEGSLYEYIPTEKGWELHSKESAGTVYAGDEYDDIRYYWNPYLLRYGIADKKGNIIAEPINYERAEYLNGNFLLREADGNLDMDSCLRAKIYDSEWNLINDDFVLISAYYFEGKCLIVGYERTEDWKYNQYFIDENGNKLSESCDSIDLIFEYDEKGQRFCEKAEINRNGEKTEIPVKEYIRG
ncbi:MAG: hypothetical protein IKL57_05560 [Oscillospiraceae bacterium]|nr:hypothetical protein [Oscillospiraceae bacterium]